MNVKKSTVFQDELPNWAIDDIQFLVQKGIINGYSNGNFGSADEIYYVLRSALLRLIVRLFLIISLFQSRLTWMFSKHPMGLMLLLE